MTGPQSSISQITVGTSDTTISSSTAPITYGVRISNGGAGKLYFNNTTAATTNGYLLNNAGDQIAPASAATLSAIHLISDTAAQAVSIEIVGQNATIGS